VAADIAVVGSYGVGLSFELGRMPDAGETVIGASYRVEAGGKGSNQAIGAARLGANVSFLTAVGDDAFGAEAKALWEREGVNASVITAPGAATMVGAIFVEPSGENRIVIAPGALATLTPEHVIDFEREIAAAQVCLVGLEIPAQTARAALRLACRHGVRTILDPAPVPAQIPLDELLQASDYLTPNYSEAGALVGKTTPALELETALRAISGSTVVLTLGAEGALLLSSDTSVHVEAIEAASVLDTTGAGDAFNAAFALALAEGADELEAVRQGCQAGSWMVQFPGVLPGLPNRSELQQSGCRPTSTAEVLP
jgi:ribokinase